MLLSAASLRHSILAFSLPLALALAVPAQAIEKANPEAKRIIAVGGTVTEILYGLGAGDRIIARDATSLFPAEAMSKPDVGYMRTLSAEGLLSQQPDLILAEDGAGPADVVGILKASDISYVTIDTPPTVEAVSKKIADVAAAVGLEDKAKDMIAKVEADFAKLNQDVAAITGPKKKVLFVLSTAGGRVMAAGDDTEANTIIALAGAENVAKGFSGYKPMNDEAVIAAAPDVVLTINRGSLSLASNDLFTLPAFQGTPAAANNAHISMDALYLVGFGPRTPAAAHDLAAKLYPESIKQ
jgi:iron complex transport system substrate-binding protein